MRSSSFILHISALSSFLILGIKQPVIYGQNDTLVFKIDTTLTALTGEINFTNLWFSVFSKRENSIEKNPYEGDSALIENNIGLLKKSPDFKNHIIYSQLAGALWRAGRIKDAKKMFIRIEKSDEPYYTGTEFHSAGNTYEYGSFTSNYKNDACLFLTMIFIEEKNYALALKYLTKADKIYSINYNCGTGHNMYTRELKNLYGICYSGLKRDKDLITLHFSEFFYSDHILIAALKKKYTQGDLNRYLNLAVDNITIIRDSFPTLFYTKSDLTEEDSLISTTYNGSESTILFGRKVELPPPSLKKDEKVTRSHFIKEFIESDFYTILYKKSDL